MAGSEGWITVLAFSPDGRRLAAGGDEPLAEVWNLETFGGELRRLDLAD